MALLKQKKTPLSRSPLRQQGRATSEAKEAAGGIVLEKEDIRLLYKALRHYTPTEQEEHLHSILVKEFEELLAIEYIELPLGE